MADDGGLSSFQKRMNAIPREVRKAVAPALMKSAYEIQDLMEELAPEDTGDLINSIAVTGPGQATPPYSQPGGSTVVPENAAMITVGNTDVRYAHLVEYGHRASGFSSHDVPARPFFWPAFRMRRKRATNLIRRAIGKAIKEAR